MTLLERSEPTSHIETVLSQHGLGVLPGSRTASLGVVVLGALVVAAGAIFHQSVAINVDGETRRVTTLHRDPLTQLRDYGVELGRGDRVELGPALVVRRGQPVVVEGDLRTVSAYAVVDRPADAALAAGFDLDPHDRVVRVAPSPAPILIGPDAEAALGELGRGGPREARPFEGERYRVLRAVPVVVHDGGMPHVVWTTGATVGEAVVAGGFDLWAADRLVPPEATPVQAGLHVWIHRSRPASVDIDGRILQTRTRATTVGELLRQEGIVLEPGDRVEPSIHSPIGAAPVKVTRIRNETLTFEEPVAFDVVYRDDPTLPLGQTRTIEEGVPGVRKWSVRAVYEDGREIQRELVRSWIETPPKPRIIARGVQLVYADITIDSGETITYWAKIRMYVTAYNATSAGKPKGSPGFGITSTGKKATRGIIAVDPSFIPYGTRMYVPGYGIGVAEDTGGGLHGPHIDVCFDDDEPITWGSRSMDIYLLTPAPPIERVRHLIAP